MATSGSTDFSLNAKQIVREALELLNALPMGQPIPNHIMSSCLNSLNAMVKTWMKEKVFLWTWTEKTEITLVANQAIYTISPTDSDVTLEKPMSIQSVRLRHTSTEVDIPLTPMNRKEYQNGILSKTSTSSTGIPTIYYYDPQLSVGKLHLNSVPNTNTASNYTLRFDYPRRIEDFDAEANDADFPEEFTEVLTYNLAVRVRPKFPAIKVSEIPDIIQMAQVLYTQMKVWSEEPEENLSFEPYA